MGNPSAERHQRVKEIFLGAVERAREEREAFLLRECSDDSSLRSEVQRLLDREDATEDSFLETPAAIGLGLIQRETGPVSVSASLGFGPLEGWDRYELGELLGRGGMGEVWKARDPRLKRDVAVKVVRHGTAHLAERFQREAETHARVQHDAVLEIYETGRHGDELFIVMQLVRGPTLKEIRTVTTVEERVRIIQKVAEGVHEAHRQGLVHRDIKPSNILVEKGSDGVWRPYVTDFGVAADRNSTALTAPGELVGTPHYMAPERAVGEGGRYDWRSDVYSLGATLYELLAGRTPHRAKSPLELFEKIEREDPPRLRSLDPTIPADLEAIVHMALERNPEARYATAKAFAEDLGRYLDHEPIAARVPTLTYTMLKKGRKHRTLVLVVAVATLLMILGGVFAIREQLRTQEQARLAQELGHQVFQLQNQLRVAYVAPAHDLSEEKAHVRRGLQGMEARWSDAGRHARGPVDLALAEAHLTLRDYDRALAYLERAWENGYRTAEVSRVYGQVLGLLWERAGLDAEQISNSGLRHVRKEELREALLGPALEHLRRAREEVADAPDGLEALIARYEGRFDEAIAAARKASDRVSWLYDTRRLEGDIYVDLADAQRDRGKFDEAASGYDSAEKAYHAALEVARSDVLVYEGLCTLAISRIRLEGLRGGSQEPLFRVGAERCHQARTIDPERDAPYRLLVGLWDLEVDWRVARGQDPGRLVERAVEAAEELERRTALADVRVEIAQIHRGHARYLLGAYRPEEALASYDRAVDSLRRVLARRPDRTVAHKILGDVLVDKARALERSGGDPVPVRAKAVDAYREARAQNDELGSLVFSIGQLLVQNGEALAERGEGARAEPILRSALAALEEAIGLKPDWAAAHRVAARAWSCLASVDDQGREASLSEAARALERVLESRPRSTSTRLRRAEILAEIGDHEAARNELVEIPASAPEFEAATDLLRRLASRAE